MDESGRLTPVPSVETLRGFIKKVGKEARES